MSNVDGKEIHRVEFELLDDFAVICDQNGFRYYLCGGALLGAIRHKGFIPWDDDIDVLMPRPDYDRFMEWSRTHDFGNNKKIVSMELGNETIPYCKILDLRYQLQKAYRFGGKNDYLWIDIFPMDGIKSEKKVVEKLYKKMARLRKIYAISHARPFTGKTRLRALEKTLLIPFAKIFGASRASRIRDNLARATSWNSSDYVAGIVMGYGPSEVMKKSEWEPYFDVEFEGKRFHGPKCWDYYLTQLYGDYMQLPPVEKRKSHDMKVIRLK